MNEIYNRLMLLYGFKDEVSEPMKKVNKTIELSLHEIKKFSEVAKASQKGFYAMSGALERVSKSISRVARLRLVRGIVRGMVNAIQDGMQNAYQFSDALGGTFASSMDSMASSYLQLKNSVGSAVSEIVSAVLPVLQKLASFAIWAFDAVAQLLALLGGKSTYTKALYSATKYSGAVASDMSSASGSAKELSRTLLGIDEINRLDKENTSSGGGSSSSTPDVSTMFAETPLSDWLDKFKELKTVAIEIGVALGAWKIAKGVTTFIGALKGWDAKALASNLAKVAQLAVGVTLSITGFTIEASSSYSIGYNGINLLDIIKTAVGGAMGIGGSALVGATVGGAAGGLIGLVVGATLSVVIGLISFSLGEQAQIVDNLEATSEAYQRMSTIVDESGTIIQRTADNMGNLKNATSDWSNVASKVTDARALVDVIYLIADKSSKSSYEISIMKDYIQQLNDMKLDGIQIEYDDTTGTINSTKESIENCMASMIEQAKAAAYMDVLTQAYKTMYQAEIDSEVAHRLSKEATDRQKEAAENYTIALNENTGSIGERRRRIIEAREELKKANEAEAQAKKAAEESTKAFDTSRATIETLTGSVRTLNGTKVSDSISAGIKGIGDTANYTSGQIWGMYNAIVGVNTSGGLHVTGGRLMEYAKGGVVGYANGGIIPSFAGGGLWSGQLFIANENATPELIGNIGQKTAVANTAQMVDAMAQGVYQANAEQNILLSEQNSLLRQILAKDGGGISVNDITSALARQNKITGRTVVNVG